MATPDGVKQAADAVAASKKVLDDADKFQKSAGGPLKKETPAAPVKSAPKAKSSGLLAETESAAAGLKAKSAAVKEYTDSLPKMHDGGKVEKDGAHNLKKGETVLPADEKKAVKVLKSKASGVMSAAMDEDDEPKGEEKKESKKDEKSEGKHKTSDKHNPAHEEKTVKHNFHRTETIHHKNGSHTVTHFPHPPKPSTDGSPVEQDEPVSYAAPDMASLHQGMDANLGGGEAGGEPSGAPEGGAPAQA
jgi:hypothetical protein